MYRVFPFIALISIFMFNPTAFCGERELILPIVIDGKMDEKREYDSHIMIVSPLIGSKIGLKGYSDNGGPINVGSESMGLPVGNTYIDWSKFEPNPLAGVLMNLCWPYRELDNGWIRMTITDDAEESQYYLLIMLRDRQSKEVLNLTKVLAVQPAKVWLVTGINWPHPDGTTYKSAFAIVNPDKELTADIVLENPNYPGECRV
jgi:hypothetical protein